MVSPYQGLSFKMPEAHLMCARRNQTCAQITQALPHLKQTQQSHDPCHILMVNRGCGMVLQMAAHTACWCGAQMGWMRW